MPDELKPCPFCGYSGQVAHSVFYKPVVCFRCHSEGPVYEGRLAIKKWNTRPMEDALRAENERLRARLAAAEELIEAARILAFDHTPWAEKHAHGLVQTATAKWEALK